VNNFRAVEDDDEELDAPGDEFDQSYLRFEKKNRHVRWAENNSMINDTTINKTYLSSQL